MRLTMPGLKSVLKDCQNVYVAVAYRLKRFIPWKRLASVYLYVNDNRISRKIFGNIVRGDYEVDENKILRRTFTADDVLLELGTGLGFNAIYCAKINGGKVRTYEGNPNLLPLIRKNMARNKVDFTLKNEIVIAKNLETRSVVFNIVEDFWSSSANALTVPVVDKVNVPTADINGILREHRPTFLMMDIEGGEADLFDDSDWLADSSVRKIMIELHADIIGEEGCFRVMNKIVQAGFKMDFDGTPKNVVYFYR